MNESLNDQALDTSIELLEPLLDNFFEDGLLKDIPFLGTAVNIARMGQTITDRIFLNKVARFIVALPKVEETKKQEFYRKLETSQKERKKTGETLVLILDRFDNLEKPEILAKIFMSYIKNVINFDQFRKLASSLDLADIDDLKKLVYSTKYSQMEVANSKESLLRTCLTAISKHGVPMSKGIGSVGMKNAVYLQIKTTELGELFINIMKEE
jgi:hypothetical protein